MHLIDCQGLLEQDVKGLKGRDVAMLTGREEGRNGGARGATRTAAVQISMGVRACCASGVVVCLSMSLRC